MKKTRRRRRNRRIKMAGLSPPSVPSLPTVKDRPCENSTISISPTRDLKRTMLTSCYSWRAVSNAHASRRGYAILEASVGCLTGSPTSRDVSGAVQTIVRTRTIRHTIPRNTRLPNTAEARSRTMLRGSVGHTSIMSIGRRNSRHSIKKRIGGSGPKKHLICSKSVIGCTQKMAS